MHYVFSGKMAELVGVAEAIIIQSISNEFDVYNSYGPGYEAAHEEYMPHISKDVNKNLWFDITGFHFPFWTEEKVTGLLDSLVERKVLRQNGTRYSFVK